MRYLIAIFDWVGFEMRRWTIIGVLLLCVVLAGATACNPFSSDNKAETSWQLVKVVRGDLTVTVSGAGNIAVANEENLTFESSSGRVDKIYVKDGDKVTKDDVLAELAPLDTDDLELTLLRAEISLTQAEVSLAQAQIALQTAEDNLESTLDKKDTLELALLNAQIDLRSAEHHLGETRDIYTWPEIETAQDDVADAKAFLDYLLSISGTTEPTLTYAQARLTAAEATLDAMITSYDTEEVAIAKMQVEAAEMALAQAQKNLDELAEEVAGKKLEVEVAKQSLEQAKQSVNLAQQSLEQARKDLGNEILTAPWDGVVASVGAKVGDTFYSSAGAGTVIVHLIDPTALELPVQVDEIDIPKIKLNQRAIVSLDALPGVKLGGNVTAISATPATGSGVVLYDVTIDLTIPEGTDLKIGMSATASIGIEKRSNVLLVPTRAIKQDMQGNPIVMIQAGEQLQPRPVVTGLSNGLWTEIVEGLSEGETVVVEMSTEAQPSPAPTGRRPAIPGMSPPPH